MPSVYPSVLEQAIARYSANNPPSIMAAATGRTVSITTLTKTLSLVSHIERPSPTIQPQVSYDCLNIPVLNRYCLPDLANLSNDTIEALTNFTQNYNKYFDVDKLSDYITDLINVWQVIAITVGTAFVIGMIYMVLIRCFAGVLIWVSIFSIMGILGGGGYWVWMYRTHYDTTDNNYKYFQYGAYGIWGLDGLFLILVLCCCTRIRLAVAIMKVTGSFILNVPQVLLLPLIFMIICLAWIGAWTISAIYLFSVGQI